jgi:hypothetical protein
MRLLRRPYVSRLTMSPMMLVASIVDTAIGPDNRSAGLVFRKGALLDQGIHERAQNGDGGQSVCVTHDCLPSVRGD